MTKHDKNCDLLTKVPTNSLPKEHFAGLISAFPLTKKVLLQFEPFEKDEDKVLSVEWDHPAHSNNMADTDINKVTFINDESVEITPFPLNQLTKANIMDNNTEAELKEGYFTLKTLGEFYTKAAKAGGMQYIGLRGWLDTTNCPNTRNRESDYRPKPAPPRVRWVIQFDDETTHHQVFYTEASANLTKKRLITDWVRGKFDKETSRAQTFSFALY